MVAGLRAQVKETLPPAKPDCPQAGTRLPRHTKEAAIRQETARLEQQLANRQRQTASAAELVEGLLSVGVDGVRCWEFQQHLEGRHQRVTCDLHQAELELVTADHSAVTELLEVLQQGLTALEFAEIRRRMNGEPARDRKCLARARRRAVQLLDQHTTVRPL